MLILTRREGEAIHIGQDIRIVVSKIQGGQVKVGIEAPRGVNIVREELVGRPRKEATVAEPVDIVAT